MEGKMDDLIQALRKFGPALKHFAGFDVETVRPRPLGSPEEMAAAIGELASVATLPGAENAFFQLPVKGRTVRVFISAIPDQTVAK
jgi:hypothetical protein